MSCDASQVPHVMHLLLSQSKSADHDRAIATKLYADSSGFARHGFAYYQCLSMLTQQNMSRVELSPNEFHAAWRHKRHCVLWFVSVAEIYTRQWRTSVVIATICGYKLIVQFMYILAHYFVEILE